MAVGIDLDSFVVSAISNLHNAIIISFCVLAAYMW